ncbi:MAG: penicillin-binding protein activator [Methylococcaceae bacterium]|nr:penicillin-binding protein activator [Methylococcaceae bacterium]
MKIRITTVFLSFLVIGMVSGCGSNVRPIHPANFEREINLARKLTADGDHKGAARIYRKLSKKTKPSSSDGFLYLAAESLYHAGKIESARKLANRTNPANLSLTGRYRLLLLFGRIFLAKNQPEQTVYHLERLPANKMSPELQLDYRTQRAKVYSLFGNHLESAREQILAEQLLREPEAIKASQAAIINELGSLSIANLMQFESPQRDFLSGWIELTLIFKQARPGTPAFDQRIEEWKLNYPGHPANIPVLLSNVNLEQDSFAMPESIGVILPLSGPYAQSGEAIRQGILIAREYNKADPPTTRFYNSDLADPVNLYRQVVANGAEFIIGPLDKNMLKSMVTRNSLSIPVLGLNQVPELDMPNLYQFGLNPEDEVDQAANSAWFDGHHRALIYTPASSHGRRLAEAFSRKWRQLGGEIARFGTYNPGQTDYDESIRQLLQSDGSGPGDQAQTDNGAAIRVFSDFIFLVAQPSHARLIKPLLDYHSAGQLAVYGTSQVYSGHESPNEDRNLSGIAFCDIPWLFDPNIENAPALETVQARWRHPATQFVRLMALGFDAYNLLSRLPVLESDPGQSYPGLTGTLSLTEARRIRRQLVCAEFQNGVPVARSQSPVTTLNTEKAYTLGSWSD